MDCAFASVKDESQIVMAEPVASKLSYAFSFPSFNVLSLPVGIVENLNKQIKE
jgi:hypothetical protein